jgi:hypothetical protein
MRKRIVLVLGAILFSAIASAFLGRLALAFAPFGHMVTQMNGHVWGAASSQSSIQYPDLLGTTMRMLRLTTFVLDPLVAVLTGLLVGLSRDTRSPGLAALAILPLSAFSAFTYPVVWAGIIGAILDVFAASAAATLTRRFRG